MRFGLHVSVSEDDYLKFNQFTMLFTAYGKEQLRKLRVTLAVFGAVFAFLILLQNGFALSALWGIVPIVAVVGALEWFLPRWIKFTVKTQIEDMKKKGKLAYSPEAEVEFYEDKLVEIASESRDEVKYSAIEAVCVVRGSAIYLYMDSIRGYLLPYSSFESKEQFGELVEFLKTKIENVQAFDA